MNRSHTRTNLLPNAIPTLGLCLGLLLPVEASILLQDNFDSHSNGNLGGQGGWVFTGTNASDFSVNSGKLLISGSTGDGVIQSSAWTSANDAYYGFDITFTTIATAGGRPTFSRFNTNRAQVGARDWATGTEFDLVNNAAAQIPFNASTTYRMVVRNNNGVDFDTWIKTSFVAGDEATPYYATTTGGGGVTYLQFLAPATGTFAATVDNLIVATTWMEAAAIPEPGTFALIALGLLFGFQRIRKHRLNP